MGGDNGHDDEKPAHHVEVVESFEWCAAARGSLCRATRVARNAIGAFSEGCYFTSKSLRVVE